jgi:hypothetical protein
MGQVDIDAQDDLVNRGQEEHKLVAGKAQAQPADKREGLC